jgi:hypothetical protein
MYVSALSPRLIQPPTMNQRFGLFRRGAVFYREDTTTQQTSPHTKSENEASTILHSENEAYRQPHLNLQIARTYLAATDPRRAGF